jgi:hypothetical protein
LIEKSDYTEGIKAQAGRFHSCKREESAFLGLITQGKEERAKIR